MKNDGSTKDFPDCTDLETVLGFATLSMENQREIGATED
jgi:hypothetical protein